MNRAKNRGARIAIMLMAIVMCFAMTTVSALGYSYTTDSYDVDIVVKKDNTYKIKETISVDFAESKHGIYRYIPIGHFKDMGQMNVDNIHVEGYNYEYYTEDYNMVIQIGDGSVYVNGPQEYKISYDMTIYEDRSFEFITKTPPAAVLIMKELGIDKASGVPNKDKVGKLTLAQVEKIAKIKLPDLNAASLEAAMSMIKGTARSMGITVEE